jgi:hypothetical protein
MYGTTNKKIQLQYMYNFASVLFYTSYVTKSTLIITWKFMEKCNSQPRLGWHYCYHSFIMLISIQPLGRFWQEPEPSQVTGTALAQCILGKFLRVVCHCSSLIQSTSPHINTSKVCKTALAFYPCYTKDKIRRHFLTSNVCMSNLMLYQL